MNTLSTLAVPSIADVRRPVDQNALFQRLRWRVFRNSWRLLVGHSAVRPLTILLCSLVVWVFVFLVSLGGFRLLRFEGGLPLSGVLVGIVFDLLFVALGAFLIFSTGLILYGSLFTSAETAFLLTGPVRADKVFAYKYQTAVIFSSWAFLLLGSPILIAYGVVCASPWYFYLFLPFFFMGFVLLPSCIGSILCFLIVHLVPRHRKQVLVLLVLVLAGVIAAWIWSTLPARRGHGMVNKEEVNRLLGRFAFASNMWVPSHWVVTGLRAAASGQVAPAFYYLALIWSNGLFLYLLTACLASGLYRRCYNRIATGGTLRKRYGGQWLDGCLELCLSFLRPTTRILLIKDFRTFRRDPQQWAQILIFSGLMLLYIFNIRKMFVRDIEWKYQNSVSLLNLCAVSLLLCTYTGRFVYPLLSLEGRKFWVLGLLPIRRDILLWGKFAFAATGTLLISTVLILLSDLILEMPASVIFLHLLAVVVISSGLSGLSVGLGAIMPNFKESDPSKIAVGFGGTLNLVVGLFFLLLSLTLIALPWHLQMAAAQSPDAMEPRLLGILLPAAAGTTLGVLAVVIPLNRGVNALRKMEF